MRSIDGLKSFSLGSSTVGFRVSLFLTAAFDRGAVPLAQQSYAASCRTVPLYLASTPDECACSRGSRSASSRFRRSWYEIGVLLRSLPFASVFAFLRAGCGRARRMRVGGLDRDFGDRERWRGRLFEWVWGCGRRRCGGRIGKSRRDEPRGGGFGQHVGRLRYCRQGRCRRDSRQRRFVFGSEWTRRRVGRVRNVRVVGRLGSVRTWG